MLEYRGSRMPGEARLVENITINCCEASYVPDNKVTSQELERSNFRDQEFSISKYREHSTRSLTKSCNRPRKRFRNNYPPKDCASPYHVGKRRHGVMTLVGQSQSIDSLSGHIWCQLARKYSKDDQEQEEKREDKKWCRERGKETASVSNISPGRVSGDSDITAENMADGSSRTSSFEDGCNLTLESAATAAESLSKETITPEKQPSTDVSFSSLQGVSHRLIQQRESCTSAYHLKVEAPFNFQSPALAREPEDQRGKRTVSTPILTDVRGISATLTGNTNGKDVEDENWLQLGLGSETYAERSRLNDAGYRMKDFYSAKLDEQQDVATLQLLPQKSHSVPCSSWELYSTRRQSVGSLSTHEQEHGRLIPFTTPVATTGLDLVELTTPSMIEGSAYSSGARQTQELIYSLVPHHSLTRRDLPTQSRLQSSGSLLSADQYVYHQVLNELRADPRNIEDEASARRIGVSTIMLPGCPYASHSQIPSLPNIASNDRSHTSGVCQFPVFPGTIKDNRTLDYTWQPVVGPNNGRSWPSFQDQQLNRRVASTGIDSTLSAMEPPLGTGSNIPVSFLGGNPGAEEWQGIMNKFGTKLHFEPDISLAGSKKLKGNLLPAQDMTTIQNAIDRFQSNRTYNWDVTNIVSGSMPPWSRSTMTGSFFRPIISDLSCRRTLSGGLEEGTMPALSLPEKMKITKPSRGQEEIWFTLQAAENLDDDQTLPQIEKRYLRIKDGKMPISVLKKYLVAKLGLASDSEVDITCRGQLVVPCLSLQHVRDVMWFSNGVDKAHILSFRSADAASSTTNEHIMILRYQRHLESMPSHSLELH